MKHRIFALCAAALFALSARGAALAAPAGNARTPTPTLTVIGSGSVTRPPDRAVVALRIETNDAESETAISNNALIADALTTRLAGLHIAPTAITTNGYALNYIARPERPDPASTQRYGYTVERTVDVIAPSVDSAGAVIDAAVSVGVTSVNGVTFTLSDRRAATRSAEAAAMADAVAQAHALASAAGVRLVRILAIAPSGGGPISPLRPGPRLAMSANVPTTIDPGNLTVDASVTVEYEIAPGRP